ncbi:MAG: VWA domain-containing protein [Acidobacteria bacterium]|nr:VWA domain-containing protein [Acidobacteriota bacterium]
MALVLGLTWASWAQEQEKKQDIPDAPSVVQPPPPAFPGASPNPSVSRPANPDSSTSQPLDPTAPIPTEGEQAPAMPPVKDASQPAEVNREPGVDARDDLYRIVRPVNFVLVPVMVKDDNDHLVSGLLPKDFSVFEDGAPQKLTFFTSDPFPLSAAVILDLGMPDVAVQKVNKTFSALEGAFSQFDEVSIYTYSSAVSQAKDFGAANQRLTAVLNDLKTKTGRNNGPPVTSGPLGPQGPVVNGVPIDTRVSPVSTPGKESHVLNDAILQAALDLSKREKARRKIIFIISDGREYRSKASYRDVLKVLLTNGITVYGVGVEGAAIPGYSKLQKLHLPRFGTGDILPKYVAATGGGEVFTAFSQDVIESVYARAIGDARNQYTLGYVAHAVPSSSAYREIEVRVGRPFLKVYAKSGYYPLPAGR